MRAECYLRILGGPAPFGFISDYEVFMFRVIIRSVLLLLLSIAVTGCVRTTTMGHLVNKPESPVKQIDYVFKTGQFNAQNKSAQAAINVTFNGLTTLLPKRIPVVFALNGIEVTTGNAAAQYELFIGPLNATYSSYGGGDKVSMDLRAQLLDRSKGSKLIWWGDISFFHNHQSNLDEKGADNFAKSVLERLVTDGIVKLDSDAIKMPEEKAK